MPSAARPAPAARSAAGLRWAPWGRTGLRLALSALLVGLLILQLNEHQAHWQAHAGLHGLRAWLLALASVLLLPVNLGLEVAKWRLLGRAWGLTAMAPAARAVMAGQVFALVTPARLGDYAGRLWRVRPRGRLLGAAALALSRFGQLAAALLLLAALLIVVPHPLDARLSGAGAAASGALGLALLIGTLAPTPALRLLRRWAWLARTVRRARLVLPDHSPWSARRLALVAALSVLRHAVIVAQLMLLTWAFAPEASMSILPLVGLAAALTFVLKSAVPSVALAELGIREAVAVAVAGAFGLSVAAAFQATLALFLINLLVPGVLALPLALQLLMSPGAPAPTGPAENAAC